MTIKIAKTNLAVESQPKPGLLIAKTNLAVQSEPAAPDSGGPAIIRGSALYVASTGASRTVALPAGSQAGDCLYVFTGSSWGANLISGFTSVDNQTGANWSGRVQSKVLTADDITAGTVTVTFGGSHGNTILLVTLVGNPVLITLAGSRNSAGAATRTVATDSSPKTGYLAILFGSSRVSSGAGSITVGTALQASQVTTDALGVANKHAAAADGVISADFNYSVAGAGDYQAIGVWYSDGSSSGGGGGGGTRRRKLVVS
jgi:hypothetical protein